MRHYHGPEVFTFPVRDDAGAGRFSCRGDRAGGQIDGGATHCALDEDVLFKTGPFTFFKAFSFHQAYSDACHPVGEVQPYEFVSGCFVLGFCPKEVALLITRKGRAVCFGTLVLLHLEGIFLDRLWPGGGVVGVDVDRGFVVLEIDIVCRDPSVGRFVVGVVEIVRAVPLKQEFARSSIHVIHYERSYFVPICEAVLTRAGDIFLVDVAAKADWGELFASARVCRSQLLLCTGGKKKEHSCQC